MIEYLIQLLFGQKWAQWISTGALISIFVYLILKWREKQEIK